MADCRRGGAVGVLFVVALCGMLCATSQTGADLDVAVPPGLPTDWVKGLPAPTLTGTGRVPKKQSGEGSVEVTPRNEYTVAAASAGFSGITTIDMPSHLRWTKPTETGKTPHQVELTGRGKPRHKSHFPPKDSHPLHWLSMAIMLRTDLHPATVSRAGSVEYLILIGQPAHYAASRARRTGAMKQIAEQVLSAVGAMDRRLPSPQRGASPYQSMLLRMAMAEVASAHPYGPGKPFANRLRGLDSEGVGPVIELTKHSHRFVRRNATTMLGAYTGGMASNRLLQLARSKDRVIRNRALVALSERRSPSLAPALTELLRGEVGKVMLVADALGKTGSPRAKEPLRRLVARNGKNADILFAAIPALGRVADGDKRCAALLRKIYLACSRRIESFPVPRPHWRVDLPDKQTRAQVIAQLALAALSVMGDAKAGPQLIEMIEGGPKQAIAAAQAEVKRLQTKMNAVLIKMRPATGAERDRLSKEYRKVTQDYRAAHTKLRAASLRAASGGSAFAGRERGRALKHLAPVVRFIACEALAKMGKPGHKKLLAVVEDSTEFTALRLHAMDLLNLSQALGSDKKLIAAQLERWAIGNSGRAKVPARQPGAAKPGAAKPGSANEIAAAQAEVSRLQAQRTALLAKMRRASGADRAQLLLQYRKVHQQYLAAYSKLRSLGGGARQVGGAKAAGLLGTTMPSPLRARSLARLERVDYKGSIRVAQKIIGGYLRLRPPSADSKWRKLPSQEHWIVIPAMQLLGRAGQNKVAQLKKIIEFAEKEQEVAALLDKRQSEAIPASRTLTNSVYTLPEVLQVAILELGRAEVDKGAGQDLLFGRLAKLNARGRYPASVALGGVQTKASIQRLVQLLDDEDGWVRFGAYRALRTCSAKDYACNWLYGSRASRKKSIDEWKAWAASTK